MIRSLSTSGILLLSSLTVATAQEDMSFIDRFKSLDMTDWHTAEYDFNHPAFATDWRKSQVVGGSGMTLTLAPAPHDANRFIGGSIRRHGLSHYGRYEVVLKAARGAGLITGFFTYTGPYYGTRHDEIDIEFLGRNTRQLHAAWFVDGALTNRFIDLDFDAADAFNHYAFEWWPDRIVWYANGRKLFETTDQDGRLPSAPSRLFANIWAADPSIANWSGTVLKGTHAEAVIRCVAFSESGQHPTLGCPIPQNPSGEGMVSLPPPS